MDIWAWGVFACVVSGSKNAHKKFDAANPIDPKFKLFKEHIKKGGIPDIPEGFSNWFCRLLLDCFQDWEDRPDAIQISEMLRNNNESIFAQPCGDVDIDQKGQLELSK